MSGRNAGIATRWKCVVAYDGTEYSGWQSQPNGLAVQDFIERRLKQLFVVPVRICGAGRTDAGVHAEGQVFHFNAYWPHDPDKLLRALRCGYPDSIQVRSIEAVGDGFHAHQSATGKRYRYQLYEGYADPFRTRYVWSLGRRTLDVERMNAAAACLLGRHDFTAFAANRGDGRDPDSVKDLRVLHVERVGDLVVLVTEASGYMYKMVRSLCGCLVDVGIGKLPVEAVAQILQARTRTNLVQTAPASGLILEKVYYANTPVG